MDMATLTRLSEYFAERADRPFGDVESMSGRTLQPFSIAGQQAAANLLTKARRALDDHNPDRARAFVDRAVRLPYDDHEKAAPAAIAAQMELFCLVTGTLEQSAVGESSWLEAAITVLADADEAARCDMRDVLTAIDHDYSLTTLERSRIHSAIASVPPRAELRDLPVHSTELTAHVLSVLTACARYRHALPESVVTAS
jgi:hypothetical protein